jgi:cytochrome o ubiquinol oxidase subunit 2
MQTISPGTPKRTGAVRALCALPALAALGGCNAVVLDPSGDVAAQQRDLVLMSTGLMLLIVVPVMALTVLFAWRYRQSNTTARYDPEWHHSTQLELVIWAAPLLIIICLGALTWMGTHILDPFRQIARIAPNQPVQAGTQPLQVQVVALDWKWLFIYPELGIATVNELAAPVDRPIDFRITSSSVMNSFYVPALAGQIYAMPGMETKLDAVINKAGDYEGFSANYSGAGFSGMHFRFHGLSESDFAQWVARVKNDGGVLSPAAYLRLERPSENEAVRRYASVGQSLYHAILNMCVEPGKMCADDMMRIDAKGGLGVAGIRNVMPLEYDKYASRGAVMAPEPSYVASICTPTDPLGAGQVSQSNQQLPRDPALMAGAGLSSPGLLRRPAVARSSLHTAAADPVP